MHHRPAIPTMEYIIRAQVVAAPEQIQATKSNWKIPTQSQFSAPIITSTSAILSITIFFLSFAVLC